MNLLQFNHWWKDHTVRKDLIGRKRRVLKELIDFLPKRQILLLKGLRRVGKTTLIYQLIEHLLKEANNPLHILYFSFDVEITKLEEILSEYQQKVLHKGLEEDLGIRYYIFLDEVHKLRDWANQIKVFYDLYPNLKFVISGSASINIEKQSNESLAGRLYDFQIKPLDFPEYLEFKGIEIDYQKIDLYRQIVEPQLFSYLYNSGFPEMINEDDKEVLSKYFRESILERIIYQDLPQSFMIQEPLLLFRLLKVIAHRPGMLLEYVALANEFKRDKRTISQYCDYLRYVFLVRTLYLFSKNMLVSERRLKKYYLGFPAFTLSLMEPHIQLDDGAILEQAFISSFGAEFFYRSATKEEVDIIQTQPKVLPIEIKYRPNICLRDLRGMKSFIKRYGCKEGLVISRDEEKELNIEGARIRLIPYWKALCLRGLSEKKI